MAKYVVDCTPVFYGTDDRKVITIRVKCNPERYITFLQPGILATETLGTYPSLGEAKRGHWAWVDALLATGMAWIDTDDAEFPV